MLNAPEAPRSNGRFRSGRAGGNRFVWGEGQAGGCGEGAHEAGYKVRHSGHGEEEWEDEENEEACEERQDDGCELEVRRWDSWV